MSDAPRVRRCRTAFTLMEVMVGLTVSASVLTLSVKLIHRSLRQASEVRVDQNEIRSFANFSESFRHDVHHAVGVLVGEQGQLELRSHQAQGTERINYRISENGVQRTVDRNQERTDHSALVLDDGLQAKFALADSPQRITLSVTQALPTGVSQSVCRHRVSAVVGLRAGDRKTQEQP